MVIAGIASGEEAAPISTPAVLPGKAQRTRKVSGGAPASVAINVRKRRRMKTVTRHFLWRGMHQVGGIASRIIRPFGTAFNRPPPIGACDHPRPTVTPWTTTEEL